MATLGNKLYKKGILNMMSGTLRPAMNTGSSGADYRFLVALVDGTYTGMGGNANLNTDEFYSYVMNVTGGIGGDQVGSQEVLTSVTCSAHLGQGITIDAADTVFTGVTGSTVTGIILFQSGTEGSADYLLGYWDEDGGSAISITPNGGEITVQWNVSGMLMVSGGTS
tara:strand:- start:281 stop:781 length:501 start_codon:yes stop_codon:yes gene_type:complete